MYSYISKVIHKFKDTVASEFSLSLGHTLQEEAV
jgi:hypothetical protein